jgi:hypothetical protein
MLVQILTTKFTQDIQSGLEGWERMIRDFEAQSTHKVPDFVLCGIVLAGVEDPILREFLTMNATRLDWIRLPR